MIGAMRQPPLGRDDQQPADTQTLMVWGGCDIVQPPFIINVAQNDITSDVTTSRRHEHGIIVDMGLKIRMNGGRRAPHLINIDTLGTGRDGLQPRNVASFCYPDYKIGCHGFFLMPDLIPLVKGWLDMPQTLTGLTKQT